MYKLYSKQNKTKESWHGKIELVLFTGERYDIENYLPLTGWAREDGRDKRAEGG